MIYCYPSKPLNFFDTTNCVFHPSCSNGSFRGMNIALNQYHFLLLVFSHIASPWFFRRIFLKIYLHIQIKCFYICTIKWKASEGKYGKCIYFSSNALARKIEKLAQESWKPVDLSPSHAYLLMLAIDQPGIQPTALVEQWCLRPVPLHV